MYKKYYSINEAAKYLTQQGSEEISESNVLYHAAQGSFRLCIWLECNVAIFSYQSNGYLESVPFVANKKFRGYVQIPVDSIAPNHKDYNILLANPVEPFKEPGNAQILSESTVDSKKAIRPIKNPEKFNGKYSFLFNDEIVKNIEYDSIAVTTKEAQIPKQDLFDFVSKTKQTSITTLHKNISEPAVQAIQEGGRMNLAIYQKLRAYCMQDIGQYIGLNIDDVFREMLSKCAKNELLALIADEKRIALSLFQSVDLTPREVAASYLLAVISNYRIITWHREPNPPRGHEQSLPLRKTEEDTLSHQTSQAVSEYVCFLPKREANALLSAWEASLVPKSTPNIEEPALQDKQDATPETKATPKKEAVSEYTKKVRRNALDPAIDEAVKKAGTTDFQTVYLQLKELAKDERPPFTGIFNGGALCYTDDNDELAELTKDALRGRLNRR